MNVRFTETAYADLGAIHAFIANENPVAATAVVNRIETTIRQLAQYPRIGPVKYRGDVRMFPVRRSPYLIFYTMAEDEVVILTIRHSSRRPLSQRDF